MFGLAAPDWAVRGVAAILAALALLLIGRQWGASSVYEDWIEANAQATSAAVKVIERRNVITARVVTQYRDRIKEREGAASVIEKEIVRYVESRPLALACFLDADWVRIHNAAARGVIPEAGFGVDGSAAQRVEIPASGR